MHMKTSMAMVAITTAHPTGDMRLNTFVALFVGVNCLCVLLAFEYVGSFPRFRIESNVDLKSSCAFSIFDNLCFDAPFLFLFACRTHAALDSSTSSTMVTVSRRALRRAHPAAGDTLDTGGAPTTRRGGDGCT